MTLRKPLSAEETERVLRWGLRAGVADARPSDAVWQRIEAAAHVQAATPRWVLDVTDAWPSVTLTLIQSVLATLRFLGSLRFEEKEMHPLWHDRGWQAWLQPGLLWLVAAPRSYTY